MTKIIGPTAEEVPYDDLSYSTGGNYNTRSHPNSNYSGIYRSWRPQKSVQAPVVSFFSSCPLPRTHNFLYLLRAFEKEKTQKDNKY